MFEPKIPEQEVPNGRSFFLPLCLSLSLFLSPQLSRSAIILFAYCDQFGCKEINKNLLGNHTEVACEPNVLFALAHASVPHSHSDKLPADLGMPGVGPITTLSNMGRGFTAIIVKSSALLGVSLRLFRWMTKKADADSSHISLL